MTIGIDYGVIKIAPSVHRQSDETVSVSIFDVGGHQAFSVVRSEFYEDSEVRENTKSFDPAFLGGYIFCT